MSFMLGHSIVHYLRNWDYKLTKRSNSVLIFYDTALILISKLTFLILLSTRVFTEQPCKLTSDPFTPLALFHLYDNQAV